MKMGSAPGPTRPEYCDWLVENSTWLVTIKGNAWGRSVQMTSPDGKRRIVEAETRPQEILKPTSIKRLDHLLGVTVSVEHE